MPINMAKKRGRLTYSNLANDLKSYLELKNPLIDQTLDLLVPDLKVPYQKLFQAARYSLFSGGKRIRPVFAIAACETLGGDGKKALIPACALEMIHTYSMIHDDLPCMDNDDFRRGKPTLHNAFPESHALLAGDFFLTKAFEVLSEAPHLKDDQKLRLISILAKNAGGHGMIGGQILDMEAEEKALDLKEICFIHHCKTGALLSAALQFGGIIADANVSEIEILKKFGEDIGLAFQIIDDILDVTASEVKHGKKMASDINNKKQTYVTIRGIQASKVDADQLFNSALDKLKSLSHPTSLLADLAKFVVERKY